MFPPRRMFLSTKVLFLVSPALPSLLVNFLQLFFSSVTLLPAFFGLGLSLPLFCELLEVRYLDGSVSTISPHQNHCPALSAFPTSTFCICRMNKWFSKTAGIVSDNVSACRHIYTSQFILRQFSSIYSSMHRVHQYLLSTNWMLEMQN